MAALLPAYAWHRCAHRCPSVRRLDGTCRGVRAALRQVDISAGPDISDQASRYRVGPYGGATGRCARPIAGTAEWRSGRCGFSARQGALSGIRFILLTLARREEAAGACWGEVDLTSGKWTIPSERTKNAELQTDRCPGKPLRYCAPLDPGAADELVFGTRGGPISNWDRRRRFCKRQAALTAGPAMICGALGQRCSGRWANCLTSSRPR